MTEAELFAEIVQKLTDSFSADDLDRLAEQINQTASDSAFRFPSAMYTLRGACLYVVSYWEGPVTTIQSERIRHRFQPPMQRLATALARGEQPEISRSCDDLAAILLQRLPA
jgi:hypothetical protein